MTRLSLWDVYEARLQSHVQRANQFRDVRVQVDFYAPSRRKVCVTAFWDGDDMWGVRFSPDEYGEWHWLSRCSDHDDPGLNGQTGHFVCEKRGRRSSKGLAGPLGISPSGTFWCADDGSPFLWLGDNAEESILTSDGDDWGSYLEQRSAQGFTVILFPCIRPGSDDDTTPSPYCGMLDLMINPCYFQQMDARIAAITAAGLAIAPVLFPGYLDGEPTATMTVQGASTLAGYIRSRYEAFHPVWILTDDTGCDPDHLQFWDEVGGSVFGNAPSRPVVLGCAGYRGLPRDLQRRPWLGGVGYSCPPLNEESEVRRFHDERPGTHPVAPPVKPVLCLDIDPGRLPTDLTEIPLRIRSRIYWSLLGVPPCGVTLSLPGSAHPAWTACTATLQHAIRLLEGFSWWDFSPWQRLLRVQPGDTRPDDQVVVAASPGRDIALVYTPGASTLFLVPALASTLRGAHWFNPRTGAWSVARAEDTDASAWCTPDDNDWVLVLGEIAFTEPDAL